MMADSGSPPSTFRRLQQYLKGLFADRTRRVFISSTSRDLADWRKQIAEVLQNAGLEPFSMEKFPAISKDAVGGSAQMVVTCDVFVGIYARRYGTLSADGRSVTEGEYDAAKELKIPRLCFLLEDTAPWPYEWVEGEPGASKLTAFKRKVEGDQIVKRFSNLEELREGIHESAETYLAKKEKHRKWRIRALQSASAVAVLAGIASFFYIRTDSYQISVILADAPLQTVNDLLESESGRQSFRDYLVALVLKGELATAHRAIQPIRNSIFRSMALSAIAEGQAKAGRIEDAERTVQQADYRSSDALIAIAQAQAKAGKFEDAQRTVQQIEDGDRYRTLQEIGLMQAKAGLYDGALQTAEQIPANYRFNALSAIAAALAKAGKLENVTKTWEAAQSSAEQIKDPVPRSNALLAIGDAQAKAGRLEDASKTWEAAQSSAEQIKDPVLRSNALVAIGDAQAKAGRLEDAQITIQHLESGIFRFLVISEIAQGQARVGQYKEAQRTTQSIRYSRSSPDFIQDADLRSRTLAGIADAQTKAGKLGEAAKTWEEAKHTAQQIAGTDRPYTLIAIANAQAHAGKLRDATETWREAQLTTTHIEGSDRVQALRAIVVAQVAAGMFGDAQRTAQQIEDVGDRSRVLSGIAKAEGRVGFLRNARQMAHLCSATDRLSAYATILIEYAKKADPKVLSGVESK